MVFGDKNQAIYGFTGAAYTPLSVVLDNVNELGLPVTRRLTSQIAALASAVAGLTGDDVIQTLPGKEGEKPVLVIDKSLKRQTQHVVRHITQLIDSGVAANKIAVLARTKALLHPVEALLLANQINTARNGAARNRKHVLRVLRLMNMLERSLERSAKITPAMLQKVVSNVKVSDAVLEREALALKHAAMTKSIDGRYKLCAKIYIRLLGGIRENTKVHVDVNRYETFSRGHANARAIRAAILASTPEAVVTGTIHSAKGGEWDHVFIVGVTDGLLPIHFARDDDEQAISEERKLLFVAITRARKSLSLFHAPAINPANRKRYEKVCRFLDPDAVRKTIDILESS
jgi:DNA helicase-2/ATP-dependent DNA helicase PcrA